MEFLVDFNVNIPDGTPESEVRDRDSAEATAASKLVEQGHLRRLWKKPRTDGETRILGLYRADSELEIEALLGLYRSRNGCRSPSRRSRHILTIHAGVDLGESSISGRVVRVGS